MHALLHTLLYIVIKRIKCTELFYQKEPEPGIGVESILYIETDQFIVMGRGEL